MKRCLTCEQFYPATTEFFHANHRNSDGLNEHCKTCRSAARKLAYQNSPEQREKDKARAAKWLAENQERARQNKRDYHQTHRDEISKKGKEWREANPEKKQEADRRYREENGEKIRARVRDYAREHSQEIVKRVADWKKQNPDKVRINSKRYRQNHQEQGRVNVTNRQARLANAEGFHNADDIQEIFEHQNGLCFYCKKELVEYDVDHFIPIIKGGSNSKENLVIACPHCNRSKGKKLPQDFMKEIGLC